MANHSSHHPDFPQDLLAKLGPTGKFPNGKLDAHDEGETVFAIGVARGTVIVQFSEPVEWVGLQPAHARELAMSLIEYARAAEAMG